MCWAMYFTVVDGASDVCGVGSPLWVGRALSRVVVAVLRPWGAVQIEDDMDVVRFCPVESA